MEEKGGGRKWVTKLGNEEKGKHEEIWRDAEGMKKRTTRNVEDEEDNKEKD
jgi:hypothetical protein